MFVNTLSLHLCMCFSLPVRMCNIPKLREREAKDPHPARFRIDGLRALNVPLREPSERIPVRAIVRRSFRWIR
jgi:hypothetical protein